MEFVDEDGSLVDTSILYTILIIQTSVIILGFVLLYLKIRGSKDDVKVVLLEEVNSVDGFLKKTYKIKIKQQIYLKNIPVGEPVTVVENTIEEANKEQIERILKNYVDPFLALGKNVVELKSGSFFSKIMK